MKVLVIHGPNLNLLGTREESIYGSVTLDEIDQELRTEGEELGFELDIHQTAREGEIIELLHAAIGDADAAIINPAAYTHTSRAIADAIRAAGFPVVEVHLSNIHAREEWRQVSLTAEATQGIIAGFGAGSYVIALRALQRLLKG